MNSLKYGMGGVNNLTDLAPRSRVHGYLQLYILVSYFCQLCSSIFLLTLISNNNYFFVFLLVIIIISLYSNYYNCLATTKLNWEIFNVLLTFTHSLTHTHRQSTTRSTPHAVMCGALAV